MQCFTIMHVHVYVSSARTTNCKRQKIRLQNIVMTHAAESKPLCAFNFREGGAHIFCRLYIQYSNSIVL